MSSALVYSLSLLPSHCEAQQGRIYRHVDANGQVSYSNEPQHSNQKPAQLPKLGSDAEYLTVTKPPLERQTCESRGGINCELSSSEGVYCVDGSLSHVERFEENCLEADLQQELYVEFETEPTQQKHDRIYRNLRALDPRPVVGLVLEIRNLSPVSAQIEAVDLKLPFLSPRKTTFAGPNEVEPYGLAVYRIKADQFPKGTTPRHLAEAQAVWRCLNCKSAR